VLGLHLVWHDSCRKGHKLGLKTAPHTIGGQKVGVGWNGGHCGYCDHCRRGEFFACVRGQITGFSVRSMNETFPFDRVSEGYDRMMSGKARFRVVLTISGST
jgi:D-arabinose 1-dehydrogenase-like Zn-dependent alcohol dehydrogenase